MNRIFVSSTDIESVGYENGTLEIAFNSGGIYRYLGVPLNIYQGLIIIKIFYKEKNNGSNSLSILMIPKNHSSKIKWIKNIFF